MHFSFNGFGVWIGNTDTSFGLPLGRAYATGFICYPSTYLRIAYW